MKTNVEKEKNYGISILRVILSFMVVIDHFYIKKKKICLFIILSHTNILSNIILLYS